MLRKIREAVHFLIFHSVHLRSRASIEAWQQNKLRLLIPYLERNIPLYKELLRAHSIDSTYVRQLKDLARLPRMRKENFIGKPVEEYTDTSQALFGRWAKTSGSSGTPFAPLRRFHVHAPWYGDSLHYRFLMWDRPWRFSTTWARIAKILVLPRSPSNSQLVILVKDFLNNPEEALKRIAEFRPHVIETHASLLYEFARSAERYKVDIQARYAISMGEQLSPASRRFIEERLHCEVYDRYGLEEFGTVATECKVHDGLHINAETFIVEVVDESGSVLQDGEQGKILVTDLDNFQMPFVRYDTGDRGYISWKPCKCGLEAPRLWFEGRYSTFLTLGDRTYHHFEFDAALDSFMNQVLQYQVVKQGASTITLRIIPGPAFSLQTPDLIKQKVAALVGNKIFIRIENVGKISRVSRGKSQIIVDETAITIPSAE